MFSELSVDSNTLKEDRMGLLGASGVHIPTSLLPNGTYRIREVYSRFQKLKYTCHMCGDKSGFRGKENKCAQCGTPRKTRRFRKLRKLKLTLAVRYLRKFIAFDYYRDHDWFNRCCICGTYLKRGGYSGYGESYEYCNRCDLDDWREITEIHRQLSQRANYDSRISLALEDMNNDGYHLKSLLDDIIGHERDRRPQQEIPFLVPHYPCTSIISVNIGLRHLEWLAMTKESEQREQEAVA